MKPHATCAATPPRPVPHRERLPDTRESRTFKLRIGSEKQACPTCGAALPGSATTAHLHLGFYPDGRLGELFVQLDRHRRGDVAATFAHALAVALSLGLQHGIPPEVFTAKFRHVRDASGGRPMCADGAGRHAPCEGLGQVGSLLDYIAIVLERATARGGG